MLKKMQTVLYTFNIYSSKLTPLHHQLRAQLTTETVLYLC